MAANAEPTVSQRGEFDWMCMRHRLGKKHPLGERMYLIRRDGEALLYCEECARKVCKGDLNTYEAKDFEALRNQMMAKVERFRRCSAKHMNCEERATVKVKTSSWDRDCIRYYCSEHAPAPRRQDIQKQNPEGFQWGGEVYLLSSDGSVPGEGDDQWVVYPQDNTGLTFNLWRLVSPEVEDTKDCLATLFKMALDKEIQHFKDTFDPNNVTLTNVFHFRALLNALFKLTVLIHHPQEGGMLEDTTTSGGSTSTTLNENKGRVFTVGKGHHVSITVTGNPKNCEPYLMAPGFKITVTGMERVEDRLEVDFDLEMEEPTKWAASSGLHREVFMIGYIDTTTTQIMCTKGTVITGPADI